MTNLQNLMDNANVHPSTDKPFDAAVAAPSDRERRKRNLIIFKVPESESTNPDIRREEDQTQIQGMNDNLRFLMIPESVIRLGKPADGKTRPLRVTLRSEEAKFYQKPKKWPKEQHLQKTLS